LLEQESKFTTAEPAPVWLLREAGNT